MRRSAWPGARKVPCSGQHPISEIEGAEPQGRYTGRETVLFPVHEAGRAIDEQTAGERCCGINPARSNGLFPGVRL